MARTATAIAAAIVLAGALVVSGEVQSPPPANRLTRDHGDVGAAERLTVRVCSDCHSLEVMTAERRTPSEWLDLVEEMGTRSDATPAELTTIRQFLTRTRGIVAVNEAPASDFVAVLGVSTDVAERVVAHRTRHGRFADREALLRVPGLVSSSVERDAEALWFD